MDWIEDKHSRIRKLGVKDSKTGDCTKMATSALPYKK